MFEISWKLLSIVGALMLAWKPVEKLTVFEHWCITLILTTLAVIWVAELGLLVAKRYDQ